MSLPAAAREFLWRHAWTGVGVLALFITARLPALTGWDDAFYVGQLTSAVADRDLLLQDDLLAFPRPLAGRFRSITTVLPSGALHNTFSVGFAVVHGAYAWPFLALSRERIGEGLRCVLGLGSLVLLALTAVSTVRLCERWGASPHMARLGSGLALASGPLALYGTRHYLNSHLLGASCVTFLLLGAQRWMEEGRPRDALLVGLCSGLLVINRWQDAVVLVALVPLLAASLRREEGRRPTLPAAALAAGACVAVGTLQLLAWRAQFSSWFLVPQGSGYMQWSRPAIVPLIVSPYHGIVPWAPGLALGLVAAVVCRARGDAAAVERLRRGLLLALPLFLYLSAAPRDWWGGGSFGPRRLATLVPIAALGLAVVLERLSFWGRVALAGALLLWWTIAVSAFFSGFDDLWLFFRGTPGWFSPLSPAPPSEIGWIDTWGPFHALKPGFTFTDHPHNADRLAGLAVCTLLVLLVGWSWDRLRRSPRLQKVVVGAVASWVVVCAAWLTLAIPGNDDWNRRWNAVLAGQPEPSSVPPFPPGVADAAGLVRALQALRAGDEAAFERHWQGVQGRTFGIREEELRAFAREQPQLVTVVQ